MDMVTNANVRYRNLSDPDRVFFHGLIERRQSQTLDAALQIFRGDWIDAEHLLDLRRSIAKGYWFTRLPYFFATDSESRLSDCISETSAQFELTKSYLGPGERELYSRFIQELEHLSTCTSQWPKLSSEIEALGDNLLLVTEQSRWSNDLSNFASVTGHSANWDTISSIGYLAKIYPRNFDALVFLGSPMELSGAHARLLFCSGLAPQVHCWVPGRTAINSSSLATKVFGALKPTLVLPSFQQERFSQFPPSVDEALDEASQRVAISTAQRDVELEQLGIDGNEKCLLLRLDESSVIPVEVDSARVSTLILDPVSGQIREESAEWPLSGPGAIVFALIEQGEQDFLWEAAKVEMGDKFLEFEDARSRWIKLLKEFVRQNGLATAEQKLKSSGVSTAPYLSTWIANEKFTRPRADADFKALLEVLLSDSSEINRTMTITSSFRGELNQVAKTARKLVCDALDSENWADLQSGEILDVLLEEFGDASYRVGKVISISENVVLVPSSQVRRVVSG
jgi:hypothetical protein